jgi:hypothetical protein
MPNTNAVPGSVPVAFTFAPTPSRGSIVMIFLFHRRGQSAFNLA